MQRFILFSSKLVSHAKKSELCTMGFTVQIFLVSCFHHDMKNHRYKTRVSRRLQRKFSGFCYRHIPSRSLFYFYCELPVCSYLICLMGENLWLGTPGQTSSFDSAILFSEKQIQMLSSSTESKTKLYYNFQGIHQKSKAI